MALRIALGLCILLPVAQARTVLAEVTGRDAAGRNTDFALNGGASMSRTFDAMGRITAQTTTSATGDVETRATAHDWRGRVASLDVTFNGALATELAYDYTVEGWLTEETRTTHASGTPTTSVRSHAYDVAGNRLSTTVDGTVEHSWAYEEGNLLATLDGGAVEFNPQGELEVDPRGYEIIRAPDGRESWVGSATSGAGYTIFRDPDGNPIAVDDGSDTRLQGWGNPGVDLPMHLGELAGASEAVIGIEGVQLGRWSSSAGYTPVATDALGSVVLDGSTFVGIPEAFGEDAGSGGVGNQRHVYAGLEVLPGLPFQLARARMLDGSVGRFTSVDPIGLQGGDHRFVYAENQPTGFVDPAGLAPASFYCQGWTCAPTAKGPQRGWEERARDNYEKYYKDGWGDAIAAAVAAVNMSRVAAAGRALIEIDAAKAVAEADEESAGEFLARDDGSRHRVANGRGGRMWLASAWASGGAIDWDDAVDVADQGYGTVEFEDALEITGKAEDGYSHSSGEFKESLDPHDAASDARLDAALGRLVAGRARLSEAMEALDVETPPGPTLGDVVSGIAAAGAAGSARATVTAAWGLATLKHALLLRVDAVGPVDEAMRRHTDGLMRYGLGRSRHAKYAYAVGPVVGEGVVLAATWGLGSGSSATAKATGAFRSSTAGGEGLGWLSGKSVTVSEKGLALVEEHLVQFGAYP